MPFPRPDTIHPVNLADDSAHAGTVFLRPAIDHPRWEIGDYTYASAFTPPVDWATHLAPYLFKFSPERLILGKFCQIADGVQFITASANHRHDGISTYPFAIFDGADPGRPSLPGPGPDTVIGHDVWIGQGARVMPGARIGNGVIIGAGSVVTGAVPSYSVIAGNPARLIRARFDPESVARLENLAWWNWPIERILSHEQQICGSDVAALEQAAR